MKDKVVKFRCSDSDKVRIGEMAKSRGLNVSQYLLGLVLADARGDNSEGSEKSVPFEGYIIADYGDISHWAIKPRDIVQIQAEISKLDGFADDIDRLIDNNDFSCDTEDELYQAHEVCRAKSDILKWAFNIKGYEQG